MKWLLAFCLPTFLCGCQLVYYPVMESLGFPKRDLFVKRILAARDSQKDAKEEFRSALEQFRSVVETDAGNLEAKYKKLDSVLQRCEGKADDVFARIAKVEEVSLALFREWKLELKKYKDENLREDSEQKLAGTEQRYDELMGSMKRAAAKMEPVLEPLRDRVLYLKHNLNARAIASLDQELQGVEKNVDTLVREMEDAIQEADGFVATLKDA